MPLQISLLTDVSLSVGARNPQRIAVRRLCDQRPCWSRPLVSEGRLSPSEDEIASHGCHCEGEMAVYRQIQNKMDLREVFEPASLRNPPKPLFSLKPLDSKPTLGRCYVVTALYTRVVGAGQGRMSCFLVVVTYSLGCSSPQFSCFKLIKTGQPYRLFKNKPLSRASLKKHSHLSHNGHLYQTDTSAKRTSRVGPCLSSLPLFDSL